MTLDRWLKRQKLREQDFAVHLRKAGIPEANQSTVNRIRKRSRNASLPLALAIERASAGAVRAEELPLSRDTRRALIALRRDQGVSDSPSAA